MDNAKCRTEPAELRHFPEENPHPVLRVSREGILLYANPASRELMASLGCRIGAQVPPAVLDWVGSALASGQVVERDLERMDRILSFVVTPIPERCCVNLYGRDMTGHHGTIARLRETNAHLATAEERYRTVFSSMNEGMALCEPVDSGDGVPDDFRFLDVNPAFERQTLLRRGQIVGRTLRQVVREGAMFWVDAFRTVAGLWSSFRPRVLLRPAAAGPLAKTRSPPRRTPLRIRSASQRLLELINGTGVFPERTLEALWPV